MNLLSLPDPRLRILRWGHKQLPAGVWSHQSLSRPFWRLYWNATPGASLWSRKLRFDLDADSVLLISPNMMVSTANECEVEHLYLHFQILSGHLDTTPRMVAIPLTPLIGHLKEKTIELLPLSQESAWKLSLILRSFITACLAEADLKSTPSPCNDARILAVLANVEERLHEPLNNAEQAKRVGMSVSSFNRQFKKELGHSFQEFLQIRRIEKACHLLQSTDDSIETIAENVGFCDRFYFSRVFKSQQGLGPAGFRKLHRDLKVLSPLPEIRNDRRP